MYRIRLEYYPVEGRSKPVEAALLLDGAQPFDGCGSLKFGRVWKNSADTFRTDAAGNQPRPTQVECPGWLDADAADRDVSGRVYEFLFDSRGTPPFPFPQTRRPSAWRR